MHFVPKQVTSLNQLFRGPDKVVCCGLEPFNPMDGSGYYSVTPGSRVMSRVSLHTRGSDVVTRRMKNRRDRLTNTSRDRSFTVVR